MTKVTVSSMGCCIEVEASGAKAKDLLDLALAAHERARDPHYEREYTGAGFRSAPSPNGRGRADG